VPDPLKEERRACFMALQEKISAARLARKVGTTARVLIDEVGDDAVLARSTADAPEIDGRVHVAPDRRLKPGDMIEVRITRADTHDLWADPI
jgi:ribosomal protein S12 methylthiotransferase